MGALPKTMDETRRFSAVERGTAIWAPMPDAGRHHNFVVTLRPAGSAERVERTFCFLRDEESTFSFLGLARKAEPEMEFHSFRFGVDEPAQRIYFWSTWEDGDWSIRLESGVLGPAEAGKARLEMPRVNGAPLTLAEPDAL